MWSAVRRRRTKLRSRLWYSWIYREVQIFIRCVFSSLCLPWKRLLYTGSNRWSDCRLATTFATSIERVIIWRVFAKSFHNTLHWKCSRTVHQCQYFCRKSIFGLPLTITPSSAKCCVHFWVITEMWIFHSEVYFSIHDKQYVWSNHDFVCRNSRCLQLKCDFNKKISAHFIESTNFPFFFSFYYPSSSYPYIIIMVLIGVNIITAENRSGGVLPLSGHNE